MKKLLSFSSILLIISSLFFNCKKDKDDDNTGLLLGLIALQSACLQGEINEDRVIEEGECTLSGTVVVKNNATLTIRPGAVIKGEEGSVLFILPGSKIIAEGTINKPIVFTSSKPVGQRRPGDWGGVIIIGRAPIENRSDAPQTEGVTKFPYGTDNVPDDNSGILKYVRIEFAGYAYAAGDEYNSLTLYAVGSGTTIENVQSHFGYDDSIELFGGRVDVKNFLSTGCGDDDVDVDEGYVGTIQNVLAYRYRNSDGATFSDDPRAFELDGAKKDQGGFSTGGSNKGASSITIRNFTMIGLGTAGVVVTGVVRDCARVILENGDLISIRSAVVQTNPNPLNIRVVPTESDSAGEGGDCNNSPQNSLTISPPSTYQTSTSEYVTTAWKKENKETPPVFNTEKIKAFPNGQNWTEGWTIWRND